MTRDAIKEFSVKSVHCCTEKLKDLDDESSHQKRKRRGRDERRRRNRQTEEEGERERETSEEGLPLSLFQSSHMKKKKKLNATFTTGRQLREE